MKVTNIVIITDEGTAGIISPEKLQIVQVEGGSLLGIPSDDGSSLFPIVQFSVNLSPIEPAPVFHDGGEVAAEPSLEPAEPTPAE